MDEEKLARIKARLALPYAQAATHTTANDYVAAMLAEVAASRKAGKTWKQIAQDFKPDVSFSADSLRQAFERQKKGGPKQRRSSRSGQAVQPAKKAKAPGAAAGAAKVAVPERPKVELGVFAVTRDTFADDEGRLL